MIRQEGNIALHLNRVTLHPEKYPTTEHYPFNLTIFRQTRQIEFSVPITFFLGENGSGKSTLLKAIANKCAIHIWSGLERGRIENNPFEAELYNAIDIRWRNGSVAGSFFASQIFHNFASILDEWAITDPGLLEYFGGQSLLTQSHGQSLISFFKARYRVRGLYLLDEPETALSPMSQLIFLKVLKKMSLLGHAQFIIATHSPMLLACPDAELLSFDHIPIKSIPYEDTDYYKIYKSFLENRKKYLDEL